AGSACPAACLGAGKTGVRNGFAYRARAFEGTVGTAGSISGNARGDLGHFPRVHRRAYEALVVRGEPHAAHLPGPAQRPPARALEFVSRELRSPADRPAVSTDRGPDPRKPDLRRALRLLAQDP